MSKMTKWDTIQADVSDMYIGKVENEKWEEVPASQAGKLEASGKYKVKKEGGKYYVAKKDATPPTPPPPSPPPSAKPSPASPPPSSPSPPAASPALLLPTLDYKAARPTTTW